MIDLLKYSKVGGCSAKIPQDKLLEILSELQPLKDNNILVDISTCDDAGVYKINDDTALIVTTDFFPAVCSDPYEFGQIAATNSISDVYAMGGKPLLVLNIVMFPSTELPMDALGAILKGGQDKINEAGAIVMGGHTIDDATVKYGLAVVGICHPDKVITNNGVKCGQKLILTKPLGIGVLIAAQRMGLCSEEGYREAVDQMKSLNKEAAEVMQEFGVTGATDITGFGLVGHLLKMAEGSGVTINIESSSLPTMVEVESLLEQGCIPGSAFTNLKSVGSKVSFHEKITLSKKMLCADAQTSGGILMAVDSDKAELAVAKLKSMGCLSTTIIGEAVKKEEKMVCFLE